MKLIPNFLRRKPAVTVVATPEKPKNTWDFSYITAIDQNVLACRLKDINRSTLDCTDKIILRFLEIRTVNQTVSSILRDIDNGLIAPDFTKSDLALFFKRYILK